MKTEPIYFKDFKSFLSSTGSIEERAKMIEATLRCKEAEEFNKCMEELYYRDLWRDDEERNN